MPINTLQYAAIFQTNLDKLEVQETKTGWMEANAGQVKYSGGREIKIPKIALDGLADYDKDNGYTQGAVTYEYETKTMTQDRGRKFRLDAADVDETNFVASASTVTGEFQRTKVVPEIDAYRISSLATIAVTKNHIEYGYTPAKATMLEKVKDDVAKIRDLGYVGPIMVHITSEALSKLELGVANANLREGSFAQGGINTKVPVIDQNVFLIETASVNMRTAITLRDGKTEGQTAGGYAPAGKALNYLIVAKNTPIAVSKLDRMKIFDPVTNQFADAWDIDYRRYHDIWVPDNKADLIYANSKDAAPTS